MGAHHGVGSVISWIIPKVFSLCNSSLTLGISGIAMRRGARSAYGSTVGSKSTCTGSVSIHSIALYFFSISAMLLRTPMCDATLRLNKLSVGRSTTNTRNLYRWPSHVVCAKNCPLGCKTPPGLLNTAFVGDRYGLPLPIDVYVSNEMMEVSAPESTLKLMGLLDTFNFTRHGGILSGMLFVYGSSQQLSVESTEFPPVAVLPSLSPSMLSTKSSPMDSQISVSVSTVLSKTAPI